MLDSELQMKHRRKHLNINTSELNMTERLPPSEKDDASFTEKAKMRKMRLQMIKSGNIDQSMSKVKSEDENKLAEEPPEFARLSYSQIIPNLLGENTDSNKIRQFYINESLARNQLK